MQLAPPEVVQALQRSTTLREPAPRKPKPKNGSRPASGVRCQCGTCRACLDNARWERIFQAKFADPTYYTLRPAQRRSSLHGLE